ncbi:GNAT family N-acetyltransferase [Alkalicoccus halolimnae]|uniref:GNAT family protein n=1 Tax=Alkalicoccus halolimnae TaxID=1667239 RepID=A0A5C7FAY5_9BACI|nr:GNAT family protein [Alkalicoccus halolimnae]TXF86578.1 GNAT family N-acetyltransferase [Alkalicoccus halolimnae]
MIYLTPFNQEHFSVLKTWINETSSEEMIRWSGTTFTFPLTDRQLLEYNSEKDARIYMAMDENHIPCGHAALRKIDFSHRSARIGKLFVEPSFRGQGYTPIILHKLLCIAFEELHLHRVALGVFNNNIRAKRIYEQFGFKVEGVLRDYRFVEGTFWSLTEMSILKPEFTNTLRNL